MDKDASALGGDKQRMMLATEEKADGGGTGRGRGGRGQKRMLAPEEEEEGVQCWCMRRRITVVDDCAEEYEHGEKLWCQCGGQCN